MTGLSLEHIISCAVPGVIILQKNSYLEKRVNLTVLFDLYAPILTKKQREVFELHELMDLSLGEIAEKTGISRQAAHDLLQRAIERLTSLDRDLSFSSRVQHYEECIEEIKGLILSWEDKLPETFLSQVGQIINFEGELNV